MEGLSKEQLEELKKISELPIEEQKEKLNDFLSKLKPEQVEWLKQQQKQQCPFCLIAEKKLESNIVFEDDYLIATLDINPANKGHILVFPKSHLRDSFELRAEDFLHLMNISNLIAKRIVEIVKADGVNVHFANGIAAGQRVEHFVVHIIPRFKGDGVRFVWEAQQLKEEDVKLIKDNFKDFLVKREKKKEIKEEDFRLDERIP